MDNLDNSEQTVEMATLEEVAVPETDFFPVTSISTDLQNRMMELMENVQKEFSQREIIDVYNLINFQEIIIATALSLQNLQKLLKTGYHEKLEDMFERLMSLIHEYYNLELQFFVENTYLLSDSYILTSTNDFLINKVSSFRRDWNRKTDERNQTAFLLANEASSWFEKHFVEFEKILRGKNMNIAL